MIKNIKLLLVALSLAFLGAIPSSNLNNNIPMEGESWINLPSSPLIIEEPQNKRLLLLSNISRDRIVKYVMGCVIKEPDVFRVICAEKEKSINISPPDLVRKISEQEILSIPDEVSDRCVQMKAKIAVIEVMFADGAGWKAKGLFSPCVKTETK